MPAAPAPLLRYAAACLCAIAVLYASVIPVSEGVPRTAFGVETTILVHVAAYGLLCGLFGFALLAADRRALAAAIALAALYGACIELLQGLIAHRTAEAADALSNAGGAVVGAVLWRVLAPSFGVGRTDDTT
ncbi:VanZ family protein [Natronomonas sp.]|uniref:VanZ family protein n=1 Tax=Natronomonas sp. TaxID=2184060 RepID=UPI00260AEFBE|nr:VanZ family protein [Natronomonas sp.]